MKPQKANMKKTHCPGTTRDTRPRDTPGHGPGGRPGTHRDTHPGHPGTTCIYEGRGGRGLDTAPGPERRQKYNTYRYVVLCLGGGRGVVPGRRRGMSLARPPWRCKHRRRPKREKDACCARSCRTDLYAVGHLCDFGVIGHGVVRV